MIILLKLSQKFKLSETKLKKYSLLIKSIYLILAILKLDVKNNKI